MVFSRRTTYILHQHLYKLSLWAVRHPLLAILIPFITLFIIACPTLACIWQDKGFSNHYLSKIDVQTQGTGSSSNFSLTQIWISQAPKENILGKSSLLESLAIQNKLVRGVLAEHDVDTVQTPFQSWNNSVDLLYRDPYPLKTLNSKIDEIPHSLLRNALKVNGFFTSAETLVVNILAPAEKQLSLRSQLQENVAELSGIANVTGYQVFTSDAKDHESTFEGVLKLDIQSVTAGDILMGVLILLLSFLQFYQKYNVVAKVNSKLGMSVAIVAQIVLSVAASNTLTVLLFGKTEGSIPFFSMWFPVLLISSSGLLERLSETAGSALTQSPLLLSSETDSDTGHASTKSYVDASVKASISLFKTVITSLLLSILLFPFNRRTSFFLSVAFLSCLLVQVTAFTAILSSDYQRLKRSERLFQDGGDHNVSQYLDDHSTLFNEPSMKSYLSSILDGHVSIFSHCITVLMIFQYIVNLRYRLVRTSSSLIYKVLHGQFSIMDPFKSSSLVPLVEMDSILKLVLANHGTGTYYISKSSDDRILVLKTGLEEFKNYRNDVVSAFQPLVSSYKFDLYFFFEFSVMVVLISSIAVLMVQTLLDKLQAWPQLNEHRASEYDAKLLTAQDSLAPSHTSGSSFHTKELSLGGHTLDIMSISTSDSPFIFSIGMDRKLLIWSPLSHPAPIPTEIPLNRQMWPVLRVVTSFNGNFTAVFGKSGRISCWSRKSFSFIWSTKVDFKNNDLLESFFRTRTTPAFLKKRITSTAKHQGKKDLLASSMRRRDSTASISSLKSASSAAPAFVSQYGDTKSLPDTTEEEDIELVFVTACGTIYNIDVVGKVTNFQVTNSASPLVSCKKLTTPRVNDRLIICDKQGDIYISTVVNNKWRPRKLVLIRNAFNRGQKLMTPATLMRHIHQEGEQNAEQEQPSVKDIKATLLVPFVGMLLLARENEADLVDAQTGTVIKTFKLANFMPGSLRIFHDQPTHCKFCGSASVATLSIAYTERYTSNLVLSTFKLESRTKTSICLRVERDPREIRCLGLESVVERKYFLPDIDKWDATDNNVIIGLKRKEKDRSATSESKSMMRSASEDVKAGELRLRGRLESRSMKPSKSAEYNIHDIWEGWTMTVNGQVTYYKIPVGVNGLLTNRIGPFEKFGAKSMVASFGNVMKLFYLGHEESIMAPEGVGSNEEESGLKFVNKRRQRLNEKKISINYGQL
ncbi:LAME_0E10440g1_1 [Lachancea meyersii CBS 8951]|uniref:LAME_0E10440g1_1 n=1 Tax=Lachancea meyersii CBS 8951 TaxID=1266667 RepID=A0A1G4JK28_9SACH|nr:LAME_0E10440g1_1 [Lachancea meyersii CBS 8951]